MSLIDWLKKKFDEKSKSNIIDCLPPLVTAVRADLEGAFTQMPYPDHMDEAFESRRSRKAVVIKAQKKLYENITILSSLPPERIFNNVILPELLSERLIATSDPSFSLVIIAAYRVCEAAAKENGIELASLTHSEILEIVEDAGELYTYMTGEQTHEDEPTEKTDWTNRPAPPDHPIYSVGSLIGGSYSTPTQSDTRQKMNTTFFQGNVKFESFDYETTKFRVVENNALLSVNNDTYVRLVEDVAKIVNMPYFEIIAPMIAVEVIEGEIPPNCLHEYSLDDYLAFRKLYTGE